MQMSLRAKYLERYVGKWKLETKVHSNDTYYLNPLHLPCSLHS